MKLFSFSETSGSATTDFEVLVNLKVTAEDPAQAIDTIAKGEWVLAIDDDDGQRGKIVYLFPEQRLTRVVSWVPIGTIYPLLRTEGEQFQVYQFRQYAAAVLMRVRARNITEAMYFTANRTWFVPNSGVDEVLASHPAPLGSYMAVLPPSERSSELAF